MNAPPKFGSIYFYDSPVEEVAEVAITKILVVPGNPPHFVFVGQLFTKAIVILTPEIVRWLQEQLGSTKRTGKTRRRRKGKWKKLKSKSSKTFTLPKAD